MVLTQISLLPERNGTSELSAPVSRWVGMTKMSWVPLAPQYLDPQLLHIPDISREKNKQTAG